MPDALLLVGNRAGTLEIGVGPTTTTGVFEVAPPDGFVVVEAGWDGFETLVEARLVTTGAVVAGETTTGASGGGGENVATTVPPSRTRMSSSYLRM